MPLSEAVKSFPITRLRDGTLTELDDTLVVEEPLEIRLGNERFTVTMRTPGDDFALTRGLLLTEGVIQSESDIGQIRYCDTGEAGADNIVTVQLNKPPNSSRLWQRTLDGGNKLRPVWQGRAGRGGDGNGSPANGQGQTPSPAKPCWACRTRCADSQTLFHSTGGLHAVGLFRVYGKLPVRL